MNLTTKIWIGGLTLSAAFHAAGLGLLTSNVFVSDLAKKSREAIAVKVAVVEPPPPVPVEPSLPPPKPRPKPRKDPAVKRVPALAKKPEAVQPSDAKPIQGLNKDSLLPSGTSGFSAPVGNTLMTSDEGVRVSEAAPLTEDLSEDAKLISSSLSKPEYTDEALDAGLEGAFSIDVFVEEDGQVSDVEIRKKIGFGMDDRIIKSVKTAKFIPRKDSTGKSIKGWAVISFRLEIP